MQPGLPRSLELVKLFLILRLAALAATGLTIIMAGAVYTHLSHHEYSHGMVPPVLLIMLVGVCFGRVQEGRIQAFLRIRWLLLNSSLEGRT